MGRTRGGTEAVAGPTLALMLFLLFLSSGPLSSGGTTTLRPFVIPDVATADPGDVVTFTVAFDNQGPTTAARVWANLTMHPSTAHLWDQNLPPTFTGAWASGNRRGYNFTNVPLGNSTATNSFTVSVQVLVGPPDGALLVTTLAVNYTDDTGVKQAEVLDTAAVRMSIPVLVVTEAPSTNPVDPGASFSYTISVRNTGSAVAGTVWINDTLPSQVAYVAIRNIPPARCPVRGPAAVECRITDLAAFGGAETYDIDVSVSPSVVRGTSFLNWVFVNFTDPDGDRLPEVSTFTGVDVRIIQDLTIEKAGKAAVAYPGATVTFTIWYNNTDSSPLGAVWINDTLPAGMTHQSSIPPASVSGNTARWQFPSVAVGANSVEIVGAIGAAVANGTLLVNQVTADYLDSGGSRGQQVAASASLTVSDSVPTFDEFAKVASLISVVQGGAVRYTVYYNNTGRDPAGLVVIQDTIPAGTVLTNPSVSPSSVSARTHEWRFLAVARGSHVLRYDLVLQGAEAGSTLVNFAFLNYTDVNGRSLPSPPPRSAIVHVVAGGLGDASALPVLGGALLLVGVVGFLGYRVLGRRRAVIDEIFLLHRDGLLIKHYTRRVRPDIDSDILSGMLIAVQNFVNESFIGSEGLQKEGQLDELRFGEFRLVIERGKWVIVAAVLSGDPSDRVKDEVKASIRDVETELGTQLEGWTGEMNRVEGADRYLQDLIRGKYRRAWGKG